jgi:hypothetical protein
LTYATRSADMICAAQKYRGKGCVTKLLLEDGSLDLTGDPRPPPNGIIPLVTRCATVNEAERKTYYKKYKAKITDFIRWPSRLEHVELSSPFANGFEGSLRRSTFYHDALTMYARDSLRSITIHGITSMWHDIKFSAFPVLEEIRLHVAMIKHYRNPADILAPRLRLLHLSFDIKEVPPRLKATGGAPGWTYHAAHSYVFREEEEAWLRAIFEARERIRAESQDVIDSNLPLRKICLLGHNWRNVKGWADWRVKRTPTLGMGILQWQPYDRIVAFQEFLRAERGVELVCEDLEEIAYEVSWVSTVVR